MNYNFTMIYENFVKHTWLFIWAALFIVYFIDVLGAWYMFTSVHLIFETLC